MKKILALLTTLLCAAPSARAAILKVQNLTNRPISVVVEGTWKNYNRLNALTIKPGKWQTFAGAPLKGIGGPLKFAFTNDMKKNRYALYETYSKKDGGYVRAITKKAKKAFIRNHILPTFPLSAIDIKGVQIKMKDNEPVIRQSWPKLFLGIWAERPWKPLKKIHVRKAMKW